MAHLCPVSKHFINWIFFVSLSLIWGSSFILMKIGLHNHLNAYQVASIRIVAAGLVLLPVALKHIRKIPSHQLTLVFLSGLLGSLLPSFLFCIAEQEIDSSLAGILNALTPVFVILTGTVFFQMKIPAGKIIGISIALAGSILLLMSKGSIRESKHPIYASLVVLATLLYGFNVNMVKKYLLHISSLHLASVALVLNAVPATTILYLTGFFQLPLANPRFMVATGAAFLLGVMGTAVATVIFYMLVKRAGVIFSSMVTYAIPIVAIAWGVYYGESFGWKQLICMLIILAGVYIVNKKYSSSRVNAEYFKHKKTFPVE